MNNRIIINGKETTYLIFEDGRCYNEKTKHWMKATKPKKGYSNYKLSVNGTVYTRYVHRLVAEAFIENPLSKEEVNHIDGDRLNNNYTNLEWVTRKENLKHQYENKLNNSKAVVQYTVAGEFFAEYESEIDAGKTTGVSAKNISNACTGKTQLCEGYQWRFKDSQNPVKNLGNSQYKITKQRIIMSNKDGETIKIFDKAADVYKDFDKKDNGYISQVLKGKRKSAWGYYFNYENSHI